MEKATFNTKVELIIGNSNRRFSGVTSTMLHTLEHQQKMMGVRVLGSYHLPDKSLSVNLSEAAQIARQAHREGRNLVFHARRNDEMLQALLLKYAYRAPIKIVFTSTAQRYHSGFSRWLMSQMDGIISTCSAAASYLSTPPDIIIPHGVSTQLYHPATDKQAEWENLGLPGKYAIGIFGRVRKQKGVELFVKACIENLPEHSDFTSVIVGQITHENQAFVDSLKADIEKAGLKDRIIFLGEQPFKDIPRLFRAMSLVCSLSYNEGFGLTALEALSSGVPVLTTRAGAWPDIIEGKNVGVLVNPGDQESISTELKKLLADTENLKRMGAIGRKLAIDKYRIEDEARALCNYFRSFN